MSSSVVESLWLYESIGSIGRRLILMEAEDMTRRVLYFVHYCTMNGINVPHNVMSSMRSITC